MEEYCLINQENISPFAPDFFRDLWCPQLTTFLLPPATKRGIKWQKWFASTLYTSGCTAQTHQTKTSLKQAAIFKKKNPWLERIIWCPNVQILASMIRFRVNKSVPFHFQSIYFATQVKKPNQLHIKLQQFFLTVFLCFNRNFGSC